MEEKDPMSASTTRRTPLYTCHLQAGGKIVDFAGWDMPIQYQGIMAEHKAVRQQAGLFDVSHMGRIEVTGPGALATVQEWICNDASALQNNQSLYSPICNEQGGIVDDCLVYRLHAEHFLVVVNASNREKDYQWFVNHVPASGQSKVQITHPDQGDKWALIAIQGPKTRAILDRLCNTSISDVAKNHLATRTLAGVEHCMLACTGYTGEDGFEIFVPTTQATQIWNTLLQEGQPEGIVPCGLGARDTLRLEMKYPLYGNDIDDTTSPLEAGLGWTVKLEKTSFVGKDVLTAQTKNKPLRRLIGFMTTDRGIPRHGHTIHTPDGEKVGDVTSGGFAPSLQQSIGVGYVPARPELTKAGSSLLIGIRDKMIPAVVVKTPFYAP